MLFTRLQFMKEKNMLYVFVQKKKKKCDSSLRFIDNLWGEKIISALKSKLIIYGTCLNKKKNYPCTIAQAHVDPSETLLCMGTRKYLVCHFDFTMLKEFINEEVHTCT